MGTNVMWRMHSDELQIRWLIGLRRLVITQYQCETVQLCLFLCVCVKTVRLHIVNSVWTPVISSLYNTLMTFRNMCIMGWRWIVFLTWKPLWGNGRKLYSAWQLGWLVESCLSLSPSHLQHLAAGGSRKVGSEKRYRAQKKAHKI